MSLDKPILSNIQYHVCLATLIVLCSCEHGSGKALKVAVLLSGGVDSSLALHLLRQAGHEVTAFYLQIWFQEDFANFWGACPWEDDLQVCQEVKPPPTLVYARDCSVSNIMFSADLPTIPAHLSEACCEPAKYCHGLFLLTYKRVGVSLPLHKKYRVA